MGLIGIGARQTIILTITTLYCTMHYSVCSTSCPTMYCTVLVQMYICIDTRVLDQRIFQRFVNQLFRSFQQSSNRVQYEPVDCCKGILYSRRSRAFQLFVDYRCRVRSENHTASIMPLRESAHKVDIGTHTSNTPFRKSVHTPGKTTHRTAHAHYSCAKVPVPVQFEVQVQVLCVTPVGSPWFKNTR